MIEKLLSKPICDLFYRFLLWAGFSIVIHTLASLSTGHGGKLFSQAVELPLNHSLSEITIWLGLLLLVVAVWAKEPPSGVASSAPQFSTESSNSAFLFGKISSDLILAGYGILAFLIGWGIYALSVDYSNGVKLMGVHFVVMAWLIVFTGFVGVLSLVARAEPTSMWLRWWFTMPQKIRRCSYPIVLLVVVITFW